MNQIPRHRVFPRRVVAMFNNTETSIGSMGASVWNLVRQGFTTLAIDKQVCTLASRRGSMENVIFHTHSFFLNFLNFQYLMAIFQYFPVQKNVFPVYLTFSSTKIFFQYFPVLSSTRGNPEHPINYPSRPRPH